MNKDLKLSHIQIRSLIVSTVVGVGVLSMQSSLVAEMGTDGWIAIIISGIMVIPLLAVLVQLFKLYPDKDFFEIGKATLGSIVFTIVLLIYLAYLITFLAYVSRVLAELVKAFLLQATPLEFILIVFILATSYISIYEIDIIARLSYFVYPIIIIFAVSIVLISLPKADFTHILPVFQTDYRSIIEGVKSTEFSFLGFELIIFAIPYVKEKDKVFKSCLIGIGTVTAIYLALFVMTIAHFSIEQIENQTFPILILIRHLDLPGFFLQNLDGFVMALWILVVFSTIAPPFYGAGKILSEIFKTKSHKYFIWGLIPVIYFIAMVPDNFVQLNGKLNKYTNILGFISAFIIPTIMLIVAYIRKKVRI